ncbi:hypothetical protein SAMN02982989_5204 [Xaviernesmea oryzae]|uniref:Uncharacterized protein n=1 Tax=Xaviernesmea oryzae TaxID=464029 RepID=A0A1X7D8R9_9HYPH|nr:hypothetical protein [Xaviernesmea oryzae]SMF10844.1 hypothetical protein SAMN02982989_5204 [Xaviernesmea oryzae]
MTEAQKLAEEYLRLGGRRKSKIDDNIVNTRLWEDEPPEADRFWTERIEPLDEERRREVAIFLPSI